MPPARSSGKRPYVVHKNLALVEADSDLLLEEVRSEPKIAPHVAARLSPTAAVLAPLQTDRVLTVLVQRGHLPTVVE